MKKILWLSQHKWLPKQEAELRRLFGEIALDRDILPFENAEDIIRRVREGGYDEVVVVVPLWVLYRLCELNLQPRPLWAEMKEVKTRREADVVVKGRFYRFYRFRRVKRVTIEFEELE